MQEEEIIIRQEAREFFEHSIEGSGKFNAIDDFHEIKSRLYDFYSPEAKSIFLDEIEKQITTSLQKHRDKAHGGKPGENCSHEKKPVKLLYYIKQEIDTLPIVAHQKNVTNPTQERNKVFISYSHLDNEYLTDIQRHSRETEFLCMLTRLTVVEFYSGRGTNMSGIIWSDGHAASAQHIRLKPSTATHDSGYEG